jgi:signal transduction histidine kinase
VLHTKLSVEEIQMKSKTNNTILKKSHLKEKKNYILPEKGNSEKLKYRQEQIIENQSLIHLNNHYKNVIAKAAGFGADQEEINKDLKILNEQLARANSRNDELTAEIEVKNEEILKLHQTLTEVNARSANLLVRRELQVVEIKKLNHELKYEIAARQKTEENLKKSNDAKDRFFSIIAHDLRNPFISIVSLMTLMNEQADLLTKEEIIELIKDLHSNAENTQNLLENLLEWSKTQTGRLFIVPEECNLRPIIDETILACEHHASIKGITIKTDVNDNVRIYADKNMVCTVIRNLLSNAIKFSNNEGIISIYTTKINGQVRLNIKDNGIGISAKNQEKLFKLESKVTSKGTANERGSGLGLILCKEFVEKNGGEIGVESEPGKGSTFSFTLKNAI